MEIIIVTFLDAFRENKQTRPRLLVLANFVTCLPPEIPRDIAILKRVQRWRVRDEPLENLWGGGGAGEVQKKIFAQGKLNEKKFMHAN